MQDCAIRISGQQDRPGDQHVIHVFTHAVMHSNTAQKRIKYKKKEKMDVS